jgi:hypothetical protein
MARVRRTSAPAGESRALVGGNRPGFVDRPTKNVHDATDRRVADREPRCRPPVSLTFMPRRRPSEDPMAIVRTIAVTQLLLDFEHQVVSHMSDSSALSSWSAL